MRLVSMSKKMSMVRGRQRSGDKAHSSKNLIRRRERKARRINNHWVEGERYYF